MIVPDPKDWAGTGFEDVREQERRMRQEHADYVANIQHAISLCEGILQLETSGGFRQFQETLAGMLQHRTTELLSARDDRTTAVLQGRCQELKAILSLMRETRSNKEALANAIKEAEDRFRQLEQGFKPLPPGETK